MIIRALFRWNKWLTNLKLSSEEEKSNDIEEMDTIVVITVDDRGKRPMGQEIIESSASDGKDKKPKLVKDLFLQVV
jgi:hypothetical protein